MSRTVKWGAAGLAVLTFIRLLVAFLASLAPDEAYYWVWSRALAPGYLDHPPMVALWIWAGTSLAGASSLGIRLLGPFSGALGSVLLYDAAERLFPGRRAGVTAAALLNATLLLAGGTVLMTPDTPLLFFWTATLWAGSRLAAGGAPAWWLAAGAFTGMALTSKYTAAFLPIGLGLFALAGPSKWLRRPQPWLGGLIAGIIFLPVVIWNAQHDWIGFLKQGARVSDWRPERAVSFLGELVGGQIGLATPGIFILFVAGVGAAIRMTLRSRDQAWCLLAAMSVLPALVFVQHAFGDRVQGNWPAIIYPAASVAAAGLTAPIWRRLIWPSAALGFALTAVLYAHVVTALPAWPARFDPVARNLFGWTELAERTESARRDADAAFIAVEPYGLAAELTLALPPGIEVIGAGNHWDPIALPRDQTGQAQGILVRPDAYGVPDPAVWHVSSRLPDIARDSGGVELQRYSVFLVRAADGPSRGVSLPRP